MAYNDGAAWLPWVRRQLVSRRVQSVGTAVTGVGTSMEGIVIFIVLLVAGRMAWAIDSQEIYWHDFITAPLVAAALVLGGAYFFGLPWAEFAVDTLSSLFRQ